MIIAFLITFFFNSQGLVIVENKNILYLKIKKYEKEFIFK